MQLKVFKTFIAVVSIFLSYSGFAHTINGVFHKVKPYPEFVKNSNSTIADFLVVNNTAKDIFTDGDCDTCFTIASAPFSFPGGEGGGFADADAGLTCTYNVLNASFPGGDADGFASADVGLVCTYNVLNAQFPGGDADGFASEDAGLICTYNSLNAQFSGGVADGFASADAGLICTYNALNAPFPGGDADGFASVIFRENCDAFAPPSFQFPGGVADGFASADVGLVCTYNVLNAQFPGGIADGFASLDAGLICTYNTLNAQFPGGIADGFAILDAGHICTYNAVNASFHGGTSSGFAEIAYLPMDLITCEPVPLPIELLYFDATKESNSVRTEWTTMSERDNDYFTIERALDGYNWDAIGKVAGAGNSSSQLDYVWYDKYPEIGTLYYRLKQTDFDGKFSYSEIRSVIFGSDNTQSIVLYPNPTDGTINLSILGDELKGATIQLYSVSGQLVNQLDDFSGKFYSFDLSPYQNGVYLMKISDNQKVKVLKIVKE